MSLRMVMTKQTDLEAQAVDKIVARAREAQEAYGARADQAYYDRAIQAVGWALMDPARNMALSEMAVATTGLGNVADKIAKNHRKTLGLLRDLKGAKSCGVLNEQPERGVTRIARPVGVIGAITPSTNPVATPTNNIINALKCGNAIILAPSPKGVTCCKALLEHIHNEFEKIGLDPDLVQMLPEPASKAKTQRLLESVDLIVCTGSQDNVRRAYSSGKPALGVGAGNAPVIVDETADLEDAAQKIAASKCFDNATSCSSENALIVVDAVYTPLMRALTQVGGRMLDQENAERLIAALFKDGKLNPRMIAQSARQMIGVSGVRVDNAAGAKFLMLLGDEVGPKHPESGEKLSLALTVYRASSFEGARARAAELLAFQGAGHSVGLHSANEERAFKLARTLPTCRVIVNQAHCFATGGAFNNGMPFSLSMGCGSWGGNSIDDNLNYRHFMNIAKIVREIPEEEPELKEIFGDYWNEVGR